MPSYSDAKLILQWEEKLTDFMSSTTKTLSSITKQINKMANFVEEAAAKTAEWQKQQDLMQAAVIARLDALNGQVTELISNMGTPAQQAAVLAAMDNGIADVKTTLPPASPDAAQA